VIARPACPSVSSNGNSSIAVLNRSAHLRRPFNQAGSSLCIASTAFKFQRICRKYARTPPTSARSSAAEPQIDLHQVALVHPSLLNHVLLSKCFAAMPLFLPVTLLQLRREYLEAMVTDPFRRAPWPPSSPLSLIRSQCSCIARARSLHGVFL
jgi:hypothetical protein